MTIFECGVCGHIEFDEAPELCLVCRSGKDAFKENAEAIKQPANPAELSEGDKKHIPVVAIDGSTVAVTVGEIEHVAIADPKVAGRRGRDDASIAVPRPSRPRIQSSPSP